MAARTISHPVPAELDGVDRIRLELERELAWTVFERNAEPLWQHVRLEVEDVLIHRWRDGDLVGETPAEAFFVRCGLGETMTQDDLGSDRLVVEIGVAPFAPEEFETFRIVRMVGHRPGRTPAQERS
jgi:phage tail sheath protein FI